MPRPPTASSRRATSTSPTFPTSQIKDAISSYGQSDDGYTISSGKGVSLGAKPATYYICCNTKDQYTDANGNKVDNPMKDVNLRRAVSLAINRQAICDSLFDGTRSPADNIVPPSIDGYEAGAWEYSKYDKDAGRRPARQVLSQGRLGLPRPQALALL
ncbi:MAG: ABC transporter substrate-binding protein [Atopobiaceae bacterium]|jgi:peptide/nickel transport system substrate-binding protein/oligopeptide transport system substrate-binding protein|nr:ABC transporter substrate-binding protein [Atopobiaceae bacterium]